MASETDLELPLGAARTTTCPHCRVAFHDEPGVWTLRDSWEIEARTCPSCGKWIIDFVHSFVRRSTRHPPFEAGVERVRLYPQASARPCPAEVPPTIAKDFIEASQVLPLSANASAALSRRCLQAVLRDAAKVKPQTLEKEIDEVVAGGLLPTAVAADLDAVRVVGNFGAHPGKGSEVIDAEPHEAEWNLDVLDELFEEFYVKPARSAERRAALNKKLSDAGKQPLP